MFGICNLEKGSGADGFMSRHERNRCFENDIGDMGCSGLVCSLLFCVCSELLCVDLCCFEFFCVCVCVLGCSVLLRVAMNCPGLLLAFLLGCSWLLCAVLDCFGQLWITLWIRCLGTWKPWKTIYVDDFVIYKYRQAHAFE